MKNTYEVWYHGTNKENAKSILKTGFRAGTWFARSVNHAIKFGGTFVFGVYLDSRKLKEDVDWQCHTLEVIPTDLISFHMEVGEVKYLNEIPSLMGAVAIS